MELSHVGHPQPEGRVRIEGVSARGRAPVMLPDHSPTGPAGGYRAVVMGTL